MNTPIIAFRLVYREIQKIFSKKNQVGNTSVLI